MQVLENILLYPTPQTAGSPTAKNLRSAFLFITAESDCCEAAYVELKKMSEVQEVYRARGAYDIIAKVNAESIEHLREDVLKRIKCLSSIRSTLTLTLV
jgi:DNA-binding Lrp family transcriptional regulator